MSRRQGFGLSAKLLLLLLAFGAIPLGLSIAIGYTVSRGIIIEQSQSALRELTGRQAAHLATELTRQRLLLRTIVRGLAPAPSESDASLALSSLLGRSLPEDGVFDGLRIADAAGRVLASVALGDRPPHWPGHAPAADWTARSVFVHWASDLPIAYMIAVRVRPEWESLWLEGHVPAADFARLFAIPQHLAGAIEPGIFERTGRPILIGHEHAREGLTAAFALSRRDPAAVVVQAIIEGEPALVATAPIEGTDWFFVAASPLEMALAPLARLRDTALLSTAVLILLIVLIGILAARSVTTPLRQLAGAALEFGRSGRYRRLRPRGADEVGLLVESFNRMADDLEQSRDEIERLYARDMERAQQLATVGELASGVAHEIRNPVTGVRGALELVLRDLPAQDRSRPLLEEAQRQLERIEGTTSQLLRYARPPQLREVVIDVKRLIDQAEHVVTPQATAGEIELHVDPSAELALVRADPELMVQVLVNLMLNGIEAMQPGGRLSVSVKRGDANVSIFVQDSGPGIPADARGQVFRPFFTTKHQGTGLGLSISQQIVTRHGGSIRIEETPGGGATFVIDLPLAAEGMAR